MHRHHRTSLRLAALIVAALPAATFADAPPAQSQPQQPKQPPSAAAVLEKAWPDHPQWLAMLADIVVKAPQIGGNDGWFRKGVSESRYGRDAMLSRLDKDGDHAIARGEFPGSDADFARLDRDHDGKVTSPDFDFTPPPSSSPTPAAMIFGKADRDGNGKLTRQELDRFFASLDAEKTGFVTSADLQEAFTAPPQTLRDRTGGPGSLTRGTFLRSFFRRELGAYQDGPALNEPAPDFTLKTLDGSKEVTLSKEIGPRPVVLIFGNVTCGPFRGQAGNLEKLYRRYKDRATFLMVYVREAHPTDGWRMVSNDRAGVALPQPTTYGERLEAARLCNQTMAMGVPMLVDTIDDAVNTVYSGIPSRFYVIDRDGKVAFKSGRGPFGFKPAEMEQALIYHLNQGGESTSPVVRQP